MPDTHFLAESPESVGIDPDKLEDLFARAEKEVREGLLPSVQIAVARNGKLAGMRTFGQVTQLGRPAQATNETWYVVYSATKAITSAAAWILIQEGKLALDERVADVVPEFGTHGKDVIRVDQLFTHTCGFPQAPFPQDEWNDREKRLARFSAWRLNWAPGTRFEYHPTSGMWVIAELVERRSGIGFQEFVRSRIAEPLGLTDLWVGLPRALHGRLADTVHVGQELSDEELRALGMQRPPETEVTEDALQGFNDPGVRESGVPGGGGTMTAGDLALFYQALLNGGRALGGPQVWKSEMIESARVIRSGDLVDPVFRKRANRALGLIVAGDKDRNFRGFGHTGSELMFGHNGAGGQIAFGDPVSGISLGYCTNAHDRNVVRQGRRTVGIASRAAACGLGS
jgi:CubicO group peptidase (beta-lactamase class C family)